LPLTLLMAKYFMSIIDIAKMNFRPCNVSTSHDSTNGKEAEAFIANNPSSRP